MTKHLPTQLQEYIHKSRYARWRDANQRRETWPETVRRYVEYFSQKFPHYPTSQVYESILQLDTMPSMRALMTAGPALERDPMAGFNCSFVAIDDVRAFDEVLYILMCGTGVGFSVERQFINKLPIVGASVRFDEEGKP
jgi:ribonucleoside-diphosphate reductase alpha chain